MMQNRSTEMLIGNNQCHDKHKNSAEYEQGWVSASRTYFYH